MPREIVSFMSPVMGVVAAIVAYAYADQPTVVQSVLFGLACFFLIILILVIVEMNRKHLAAWRIATTDFRAEVSKFREALKAASSPIVAAFARSSLESVETLYCGGRIPVPLEISAQRDDRSAFRLATAGLEPTSAARAREQLSDRARGLATEWDDDSDQARIRANVAHALVFDSEIADDYFQSLHEIRFVESDYIQYRCILELAASLEPEDASRMRIPMVLGSGGFLVYPRGGELVIQRRSGGVDIEPRKLHVFGGNFEPDLNIPGLGHDFDLKSNAAREIAEESRAILNVDDCIIVLHKEDFALSQPKETRDWRSKARYLPAHFLGVVLSDRERSRIKGSAEGQTAIINRRDLVATLRETKDWVPGGWLTVMLWLYLGAPCQGGERFMCSWQAKRMFKQVLRK